MPYCIIWPIRTTVFFALVYSALVYSSRLLCSPLLCSPLLCILCSCAHPDCICPSQICDTDCTHTSQIAYVRHSLTDCRRTSCPDCICASQIAGAHHVQIASRRITDCRYASQIAGVCDRSSQMPSRHPYISSRGSSSITSC